MYLRSRRRRFAFFALPAEIRHKILVALFQDPFGIKIEHDQFTYGVLLYRSSVSLAPFLVNKQFRGEALGALVASSAEGHSLVLDVKDIERALTVLKSEPILKRALQAVAEVYIHEIKPDVLKSVKANLPNLRKINAQRYRSCATDARTVIEEAEDFFTVLSGDLDNDFVAAAGSEVVEKLRTDEIVLDPGIVICWRMFFYAGRIWPTDFQEHSHFQTAILAFHLMFDGQAVRILRKSMPVFDGIGCITTYRRNHFVRLLRLGGVQDADKLLTEGHDHPCSNTRMNYGRDSFH